MTTISIRISERATLTTTDAAARTMSAWARLTSWFQSTWCLINGGHYKVLHTAPDKMALRCVACGHMSPGWEVGAPRLARTMPSSDRQRAHARRPAVA
jgi:hypothetical protein